MDSTPIPNAEIGSGLWTGRLIRFDSLASTNTWALEHFDGLGEGDLVWAESQTAGRGRFERVWTALPGKSLTLSVVLRDPAWIPLGPNLGQIAAWALVGALGRFGVNGFLKWPNDVLLGDAKLAGILVERASGSDGADGFVIGIGMNVNVTAEELAGAGLDRPASSLSIALGRVVPLADVVSELRSELTRCFDDVRNDGTVALWRDWYRHDWLTGRSVRLCGMDGDSEVGEYLGISPEGGLRLRTLEGYEKVFWSGDVERVMSATVS